MTSAKESRTVRAGRPPGRPSAEAGSTPFLLVLLTLCLVVLLFFGWHITLSSRPGSPPGPEKGTPADRGGAAGKKEESGDGSWDERAATWRKLLGESEKALGTGDVAFDGEKEDGWYEVEALGGAAESGGAVEIVWSSHDGTVWEKVLDRRLQARKSGAAKVMVEVSPAERQRIAEAGTRGRVFAVPP